MYGIDCIGVGDHSVALGEIVAGLESLGRPLHAVALLNCIPTGRVGLAAQLSATIVGLGVPSKEKR